MNKETHGEKAPGRGKILSVLMVTLGCAVGAASYPLFLTANNIAPGGATGIATVLHFLFGLPVGAMTLLLNVPLLLLGLKILGGRFVIRTVITTALFSMLIDLLPVPCVTDDPLLAAVYGGVILGVGVGMILRGGASTGGTDLTAMMIHRRFSFIPVSVILFILDCCVILLAMFTMSTSAALYSMIEIFICSKTVDLVLTGYGHSSACYIFSVVPDAVSARIMHELKRGVTEISVRGGYSGNERTLLLSVMNSREVPGLKKIVKEEDPGAFMFVTDTHEALGEGFGKLDDGT